MKLVPNSGNVHVQVGKILWLSARVHSVQMATSYPSFFKNRDHANIINYIDKNVKRTSTARAHESRNFHVQGTT